MKILTSEQMRNIDRRATEQFGIPSILLMENAARAAADAISTRFRDAEKIAIFCGTGQNGGDGLAIARQLASRGATPVVTIVGDRAKYSGDSETNLQICERLGLAIDDAGDGDSLDAALVRASETDLIVDAIFGTGLNRPASGLHADAIRGIQSLRLPVVSIDVPSGLDASSAEVAEPVVRAELTVTFALPKIAHLFAPASEYCGEIVIADISIPVAAVEIENVRLSLTTASDISLLLRPRDPTTHKGSFGHVAIIAGSEGRSGAAILSARGAVRGGAGLVTVITDERTARVVDSVSVESMTIASEPRSANASTVLRLLDRFSAVVLGPGLPDTDESYEFVRGIVPQIAKPLVVDASALNAFAGQINALRSESGTSILTPHPGELARLLGLTTREVLARRIEMVQDAARRTNCVVVLKGNQTLVADPDGFVAVNPTGNPGMASGGMGDVLAGLLGALLARGSDPFEAARAGVYLHGLAGDLLREESSDTGLTAMDLANRLPFAVRKIREEA